MNQYFITNTKSKTDFNYVALGFSHKDLQYLWGPTASKNAKFALYRHTHYDFKPDLSDWYYTKNPDQSILIVYKI